MCLFISHCQGLNEESLRNFLDGRKEVYVYKVLQKWPDEDFYRSLHRDYIWDFKVQEIYQVDRNSKPTQKELDSGEVHIGFHIYGDFDKTIKIFAIHRAYLDINVNVVIAKFKVKAENIVAVEPCAYEELVCTKLEFIEVVKN
jgi:hypothetical protein